MARATIARLAPLIMVAKSSPRQWNRLTRSPGFTPFSSKKKLRARQKKVWLWSQLNQPLTIFPHFQKRSDYAAHFRQFLSLSLSFSSASFPRLFSFLFFSNFSMANYRTAVKALLQRIGRASSVTLLLQGDRQ